MTSRAWRIGIALLVGVGMLLFAAWFDGQVLRPFATRQASAFDQQPVAWAMPLGYIVAAVGVLVAAILAWWSRSLVVGIAYTLIGGSFAFLVTLLWVFSASVNGAPPALPRPLADLVSQVYLWATGPTSAASIVGAGMLLAGIGAIALALGDYRGRRRRTW